MVLLLDIHRVRAIDADEQGEKNIVREKRVLRPEAVPLAVQKLKVFEIIECPHKRWYNRHDYKRQPYWRTAQLHKLGADKFT